MPVRVSCTCSTTFTTLLVEVGSKTLTMLPALFKRDKKRATAVVAECRIGRSGTLRTAPKGKSPAESGTVRRTVGSAGPHKSAALVDAVGPVPASSDADTGSPTLNKRGLGKPERGRVG